MPPREPGRTSRIVRAYKHGWPRLAVHQMAVRKLRGGFASLRAQGLERLREALGRDPSGVVLLANHSCWWDLFFAHFLNMSIPVDGYGMMEHFNLRRFGFFRRIGAFSVDRTDARSVREALDYTVELLGRPRAGVWIFPQGKIVANDARPIRFQPGLRALVRRAGRVRVVPVALRYEFWQEERPEALVRFGEPVWVEHGASSDVLADWEHRLTAELEALRADSVGQVAERFTPILSGARSISDRYARLRALIFGATPGAPEPRP